MYRKYATMTDQYLRPKSVLFGIQVALTILMVFIATARLILQATIIGKSSFCTFEKGSHECVNFVFDMYDMQLLFYFRSFFLLQELFLVLLNFTSRLKYLQPFKENIQLEQILQIKLFILNLLSSGDRTLYGYMIVYHVCNLVCWPLSLRIIFLERNYLLPTVPTRGHGVVLLIFWTLVFVSENLAFLNLRNEDWWFDLTT